MHSIMALCIGISQGHLVTKNRAKFMKKKVFWMLNQSLDMGLQPFTCIINGYI